jgi:soluble lytic murein transglycosylase-like protein
MGLMQLMPGTWRELRGTLGLGANPHEPRDNILAGAAYLRMMYDRFGYPGLFAAYNAGPARYRQHLATGRRLPAETIAYVAGIAGAGLADTHHRQAETVIPAAEIKVPAPLFAVRVHPPSAAAAARSALPPAHSLFVQLSAQAD